MTKWAVNYPQRPPPQVEPKPIKETPMQTSTELETLFNDGNTTRLSARVPSQVKEAVKTAAALSGLSESKFIALAAYQAAQQVIENEQNAVNNRRDETDG